MNESLIYVVFAAALFVPFVPGLLELQSGKDEEALLVDQSYARDPRYLGKSLRGKVRSFLSAAQVGARERFLDRKSEFARVVKEFTLPNDARLDDVLISHGSVVAGSRAQLSDVYAQGSVSIGLGSRLRTLAADSRADLGQQVTVSRWIDVDGDLVVGARCDLGQSASATGSISLGEGTVFRRVFALPVQVGENDVSVEIPAPTDVSSVGDVISKASVDVPAHSNVGGSIKSTHDVVVREGARVFGNVVARGNVTLERNSVVYGHVFSEGRVSVGPGAIIGTRSSPKTLSASKALEIAGAARIFGWIICESGGKTVAGKGNGS